MDDLILESKDIFEKAMADFKPDAVCVMVSGGDDSMTTLTLALKLGIKVDFIIHGNTGTGLPQATEFARGLQERTGVPYIEADAGLKYETYVRRKGFFGTGGQAHSFAYHILKADNFRKVISKYIRKRRRGVNVLLLNGVRLEESKNRMDNFANSVYRRDPASRGNIWVNIIQNWERSDCLDFLADEKIERSPVSLELGRSGECMCGTMQNRLARQQASEFCPKWGKWLDNLEKEVMKDFPWQWGQSAPKGWHDGVRHLPLFNEDFQPACVGCKAKAAQYEEK